MVTLLAVLFVGVFGGIGLLLLGLGSFERWLLASGDVRRPRGRKNSPSIDAAAA